MCLCLQFGARSDAIFVPSGGEALGRDAKVLEMHLIDAGHFALESNEHVFANRIGAFV